MNNFIGYKNLLGDKNTSLTGSTGGHGGNDAINNFVVPSELNFSLMGVIGGPDGNDASGASDDPDGNDAINKFVVPFELDFSEQQKCMYCSATSQCSYRALSLSHGIISCSEHANWAKRDIGAYLHTRRLVKVEKLIERFPQLSKVNNIRIRNSDGRIKVARLWLSTQRRNGDYVFVHKAENDGWRIRVAWDPEPDSPGACTCCTPCCPSTTCLMYYCSKQPPPNWNWSTYSPDYVTTKNMLISELATYGINVNPIIKALNEGFYMTDYEEQQIAIINSQENQEPTLKKNE